MSSLLESTRNTRAILGERMRYIRSDAVTAPTGRDLSFLLAHGVQTVIDLRTEAEAAARPCPLARHPSFRYHLLPVTGGDRAPATPFEVPQAYLAMCDRQMARILGLAEGAPGGVLYFCNAGKDRTGVVSALLLHRLGYSDDSIAADYMRSAENLSDVLAEYLRLHPDTDPQVITPRRAYITSFLRLLRERGY